MICLVTSAMSARCPKSITLREVSDLARFAHRLVPANAIVLSRGGLEPPQEAVAHPHKAETCPEAAASPKIQKPLPLGNLPR
jgi:hypothetical protein